MTATIPPRQSLPEAICRRTHPYEWVEKDAGGKFQPGTRPSGPCLDCQRAAEVAIERGAR